MDNKEKTSREMVKEFCDWLIFCSSWKWFRCGNRSQGIEWRTFFSWFFESLPKVFRHLYLGPNDPTIPTNNNIKYPFN